MSVTEKSRKLSAIPESLPGTRTLWNVRIPMRDGVELAADVHLPPTGLKGGPYPVIFTRDPYNRQVAATTYRWRFFTEQGYVMVNQDSRGRFDSDGEFYPFLYEGPDGHDSIEWIAKQPWCTGKIGMMGGSYAGWTQWAAAREKSPHLVTLVSSCAAGKYLQEFPWDNGGISLVMFSWLYMMLGRSQQNPTLVDWGRVYRHLPLRTLDKALGKEIPWWKDWIGHHTLDDYWRHGLLDDVFEELDIPALHVTGWFDGDQPGTMYFWDGMKKSKKSKLQRLVLGPWWHGAVVNPTPRFMDMDFTPKSVVDMNELHLKWFDRWLKEEDNGVEEGPAVRYFYTGINEWRDAETWPPPDRVETSFYLHSAGRANTLFGDGRLTGDPPNESEPEDTYLYDPASVEEFADVDFFGDVGRQLMASADRRDQHLREDILVYTSDPLEEPVAVSGKPVVVLYASSNCPDTDWVVSLTDVSSSGRAVPIHAPYEGRLRARFREGLDKEVFMTPGEVYEFRIDFGDVAHVFEKGHRIRLTVKSWDFPLFARNLNTDESIADGKEMRVATNRVLHKSGTESRVILPVDSMN